ncbi:hypothetical protein MMC11_005720 [Xylographa trunciseda]|nr:hypothetical protein [Xylographa trunciseda]
MSSHSPAHKLILILQKQMKLEEEHESLVDYINAATTCTVASRRLKSYIKLGDTYYLDGSFRSALANMRERLLDINNEFRNLAIRKKVLRDRDTRLIQKRLKNGAHAYTYSAR